MFEAAKIDAIREAAAQISAVGDLLMRSHDVPQETLANSGWLVRDLAEKMIGLLEPERCEIDEPVQIHDRR